MENSGNIIKWDGREWQKTGGKYYILRAKYKYRTGEMLHRAIWKSHFGEIPKGYVVHHKDHNPDNNNIDNLECLSNSEHQKMHAMERIGYFKENAEKNLRPALYKWQKSEAGQKRLKEIGKELAKRSYENNTEKAICSKCGIEYRKHKTTGTGLCRKCGKLEASKKCYRKKNNNKPNCFVEIACKECNKIFKTNTNRTNKDGLCKNCAQRKKYRDQQKPVSL